MRPFSAVFLAFAAFVGTKAAFVPTMKMAGESEPFDRSGECFSKHYSVSKTSESSSNMLLDNSQRLCLCWSIV